MAGFRNEGFSGRVTEVDSNNNVKANFPSVLSQIGYLGMASIVHDGVVGDAKVVRSAEVSINRRLRVGVDVDLFQDTFNYSSQFSATWNVATTETVTWGTNGFAFINSASTTGATNTVMTTYKFFPMYNGVGLGVEFDMIIPQVTDATTTLEWGIFQATGASAPTDGVLFRYTNNIMYGVINYAGTETTITLTGFPTVTNEHEYVIRVEQEMCEFWIDGNLYGHINTPVGQAGPCQATYQPLCFRTIGTSTTVASAKLGVVRLTSKDISIVRPWAQLMAGFGLMGYQGPHGATQGSTAAFENNRAVGAGQAVTNNGTTPAAYVGLGGQFDVTPTLAANNDGILCYYQVPAGSVTVPGKSLVITGIKIQSIVTTILALAAPMTLIYSLAYGSTALSLATTESATAKAYRRVPLGYEMYSTVNAPVGTFGVSGGTAAKPTVTGIVFSPVAPITVNAGEYVTIAMKNVGTVTTSGVITIVVSFDSHWE